MIGNPSVKGLEVYDTIIITRNPENPVRIIKAPTLPLITSEGLIYSSDAMVMTCPGFCLDPPSTLYYDRGLDKYLYYMGFLNIFIV